MSFLAATPLTLTFLRSSARRARSSDLEATSSASFTRWAHSDLSTLDADEPLKARLLGNNRAG